MRNHISTSALQIPSSRNDQTEGQDFQNIDPQDTKRKDFLHDITGHAISVLDLSPYNPRTEIYCFRAFKERYSIRDLFSFSEKETKRMCKIISIIWQIYGLSLQCEQRDENSLTSQEFKDFSNAAMRLRSRLWGLIPESVADSIHAFIRWQQEDEDLDLYYFPCEY